MTSIFSPRSVRKVSGAVVEAPEPDATLVVTIVEATGLPRVADYYVIGELKARGATLATTLARGMSLMSTPRESRVPSVRTETVRKTDQPRFRSGESESWPVAADTDPAAAVQFSMYARRLLGSELVGQANVLLTTLLADDASDRWLSIRSRAVECGSMRVRATVTRRDAIARPKSPPPIASASVPPTSTIFDSATESGAYLSARSSLHKGQSLVGSLPAAPAPPSDSQQGQGGPGAAVRAAATFSYKVGDMVGRGAFGKVFQAMNLENGELMAVKCVELNNIGQEELEEIKNEVALLRALRHRHVVQYVGTHSTAASLNILMEYCPGGSVSALLESFGALPEAVLARYARQVAEGVAYVHARQVMHRDIKGANILVAANGLLKLADFGASAQLRGTVSEQGLTTMAGSPYWMAPEVIRQERYGRPADCWSMGMTIIEMATGTHPWPAAANKFSLMWQISQSEDLPPYPAELSRECRDLIARCISRDVDARISAEACLAHPWLARAPQAA